MNSGESPDVQEGQSGIVRAALFGLCPKCSEATLFDAPARIAMACSNCELDLARYERGGRLSGLFTAFVAVLIMLAALGIDTALRPPLWLQLAFWAPVTVFGVLGALRMFKTILLYAAFERSKP